MTALYDTCSLITLDKLLEENSALAAHFPERVLCLEVCLSRDQVYPETAARLVLRVEHLDLPPVKVLTELLSDPELPRSLSEVDRLIFATAVHSGLSVVTGDKRLAKALQRRGHAVADMAIILRILVLSKKLRASEAESLLKRLAARQEFLVGMPNPSWSDLKRYSFPD